MRNPAWRNYLRLKNGNGVSHGSFAATLMMVFSSVSSDDDVGCVWQNYWRLKNVKWGFIWVICRYIDDGIFIGFLRR